MLADLFDFLDFYPWAERETAGNLAEKCKFIFRECNRPLAYLDGMVEGLGYAGWQMLQWDIGKQHN